MTYKSAANLRQMNGFFPIENEENERNEGGMGKSRGNPRGRPLSVVRGSMVDGRSFTAVN